MTGFILGVAATLLIGGAVVGNWIGWKRMSGTLPAELRRPFHTR